MAWVAPSNGIPPCQGGFEGRKFDQEETPMTEVRIIGIELARRRQFPRKVRKRNKADMFLELSLVELDLETIIRGGEAWAIDLSRLQPSV